ncbi:bifunctional 5,10-methylenetetrahydrofolate dehydrogenase/5,10-methenyltetrahydrofolate cyclohydrolase [Candidatus Saccharibacteria bacterium]|nr:bifunctional 5,10-methylenetetrahydrofolate dehydrogenase/5,10-methenyltetrahydrofolate cyclohydrolase [Candidatus Saccharibacteria bacterium]
MKILDGAELAGFIKERQLKQVRALRQSWRVIPRLAIIQTTDIAVIDVYIRLKQVYGADILVEVDVHKIEQVDLMAQIETLNKDDSVHGIIIQLPLTDSSQTDAAVSAVAPEKDVDGLGQGAVFTPATAMAIDWLLAGYNVALEGKVIAIVGNGRLVGEPLARLWLGAGLNVTVYDDTTLDLTSSLCESQVIVTATGVPGLIKRDMVQTGAVVVDAGTASEHGKIVGDVGADVRELDDITITPLKGGVGPLTVAALFDNVIQAARVIADRQGQQDL